MYVRKGLALPRASHCSEIAMLGSRRLHSTLAAVPVFFVHIIVTAAKYNISCFSTPGKRTRHTFTALCTHLDFLDQLLDARVHRALVFVIAAHLFSQFVNLREDNTKPPRASNKQEHLEVFPRRQQSPQ